MADVTVIRTQTAPSGDPARARQLDTFIIYKVEPSGPIRTAIVSSATPSAGDVQTAIRNNEARLSAIDGQKFSV